MVRHIQAEQPAEPAPDPVVAFIDTHACRLAEQAGESWASLDGDERTWWASQVHDVLNNLRADDHENVIDGRKGALPAPGCAPRVLTVEGCIAAARAVDRETAAVTGSVEHFGRDLFRHLGSVTPPPVELSAWGVLDGDRCIGADPVKANAERIAADRRRLTARAVEVVPLYRAMPPVEGVPVGQGEVSVTVGDLALEAHDEWRNGHGWEQAVHIVLARHVGKRIVP